jgi:hypothetical protein
MDGGPNLPPPPRTPYLLQNPPQKKFPITQTYIRLVYQYPTHPQNRRATDHPTPPNEPFFQPQSPVLPLRYLPIYRKPPLRLRMHPKPLHKFSLTLP